MDCELCMNDKATDVSQTDWGFRHTCASCAGSIIRPLNEECFNTVAKRFMKELLHNNQRPPIKPK
jgi:hypothetical protein